MTRGGADGARRRWSNSGEYDGLDSEEAHQQMTADARARGIGEGTVQYRLKDWGISRQRYWGTPIPVLYCEKCGMVPVPSESCRCCCRRSPSSAAAAIRRSAQIPEFVNTTCPKCGGPARRETDTMDTFVDSSWYFFRFCDPTNARAAVRSGQSRRTGARSISTAAASSTRSCT